MPPKRAKASSFPAARIKRIMQQDDDIGKVAGASPLVTSKAVELFLQDLVLAMENEARQKGTRKVNMYHVKRAVANTPSLDFLKDLVSTIPDPSGADEEDGGAAAAPKQRKPRGPSTKRAEQGDAAGSSGASSSSRNGAAAVKAEYGTGPSVFQQPPAASTSQAPYGSYYPPAGGRAASHVQPKQEEQQRVSIPISSLLGPSDYDEQQDHGPAHFGNGGAQSKAEDDDYEDEKDSTYQPQSAQGTGNSYAARQPVTSTRTDLAEDADYDDD